MSEKLEQLDVVRERPEMCIADDTEVFSLEMLQQEVERVVVIQNPFEREKQRGLLEEKARKYRMKTAFERYYTTCSKATREQGYVSIPNWCMPSVYKGKNIYTDEWTLHSLDGVFKTNRFGQREYACKSPIVPIERLTDIDDKTQKLRLVFYRDDAWQEEILTAREAADRRKILKLSDVGCLVDSESAKNLVSYLSDFALLNDRVIPKSRSCKRFGWVDGKTFIPYDTSIYFDGDGFKPLYESVHEKGDRSLWYEEIKRIRAEGNAEIKIMIAAAFASILLEKVGGLPFIVDLWGLTEGGKSVTMKVCASVWADPEGETYIGDFQNTPTALEIKSSVLNHLPLLLDDSNKISKDLTKDNAIETLIYTLCSGKGKSRSNKNLGIEPEKKWKNIIISNGEKPLQSYVKQGGALNRVIELECSEEHFFPDPGRTMDIIKENYGYAGHDFVEMLKEDEEIITSIKKRRDALHKEIMATGRATEKQSLPAALLVAVDEVLTEKLFCDGNGFTAQDISKHLANMADISEGARCYEWLKDLIVQCADRFSSDAIGEKWGAVEHGDDYTTVYFLPSALSELCEKKGFSKKQLLKWLDVRGLIKKSTDEKRKYIIMSRKIKNDKSVNRAHVITLVDDPEKKTGWIVPDDIVFD